MSRVSRPRSIRRCWTWKLPAKPRKSLLRGSGRNRPNRWSGNSKSTRITESPLREIGGEALEIGERAVVERLLVGRPQHHARGSPRFERFLPARRAQAPAVTGLQTWKTEIGHRRRKIVAARFGKFEKLGG